ncbi:hypothetical protein HK101_006009 [Irineochytrium annulatum]|nr:hypothetical protein HK101_006009 [Irineochytrium annulatum]
MSVFSSINRARVPVRIEMLSEEKLRATTTAGGANRHAPRDFRRTLLVKNLLCRIRREREDLCLAPAPTRARRERAFSVVEHRRQIVASEQQEQQHQQQQKRQQQRPPISPVRRISGAQRFVAPPPSLPVPSCILTVAADHFEQLRRQQQQSYIHQDRKHPPSAHAVIAAALSLGTGKPGVKVGDLLGWGRMRREPERDDEGTFDNRLVIGRRGVPC